MGLVAFVAHQHYGQLLVGVVLGLLQPLGDAVEGVAVCDVVHEHRSDGAPVVRPSNRLEDFLTRLRAPSRTVSHTCILTLRPLTSTVLDPNSTPMVVSLSTLKRPSRNCIRTHDLPTLTNGRGTGVDDDVLEQVVVAVHREVL